MLLFLRFPHIRVFLKFKGLYAQIFENWFVDVFFFGDIAMKFSGQFGIANTTMSEEYLRPLLRSQTETSGMTFASLLEQKFDL